MNFTCMGNSFKTYKIDNKFPCASISYFYNRITEQGVFFTLSRRNFVTRFLPFTLMIFIIRRLVFWGTSIQYNLTVKRAYAPDPVRQSARQLLLILWKKVFANVSIAFRHFNTFIFMDSWNAFVHRPFSLLFRIWLQIFS